DSVHLTPETISFRNVTMYDQERNPAVVNAVLTHNGLFQEMTYDATIKGTNILAMDTHAENNDYFFGKAYANGTVRIFGDQAEANIIVNAVSQPQTKCYIQMGGASKASDNSFITFVNKKVNTRPETIPAKKVRGDFNVKINLQIDVNPNAEMELLVDPKGGDVITGTGNGSLHVEFDTFSDIKLYGTYTLDNGYYLFTLQNVIRKEFKIDKGSTIAWTGDPFNAQVKIRALYPLTASLNDLDPTILSQGTRSTVPVNCVLKLSDNLMKPTVSFDINLPQSDESIKQRVRNIINTDEMMNRQIIYLLVFNKFFTPDYLRTANSTVFNNEGLSLLLSTASAQINSLVSQFTKSNNFTVGLDYQQRDLNSSEIMAPFSYQPSNRWLVNGNLGYRMDNAASSTNKFIGDVDIEYLLSKMGKFRLKFYNHTIDRYLLQQSSETVQGQGIGILYKEEFASVDDLFSYYWRLLTVPAKKKSNEKKQTNNK
ncbi:MAG: translocation/assembly module TamB domain-containing protein, partial [Paludibacter sp.]|nr:translocation/assembly module TamB domain-containing protein [Paludibacter sp.]